MQALKNKSYTDNDGDDNELMMYYLILIFVNHNIYNKLVCSKSVVFKLSLIKTYRF